jgi:hypothetical protein
MAIQLARAAAVRSARVAKLAAGTIVLFAYLLKLLGQHRAAANPVIHFRT